jgi:hypothetical protein
MKRNYSGLIAVFFAISGCGGSGGDAAPVAAPDNSLEITSANAMEVSKVAYDAAIGSQQLGTVGSGGGLVGNVSGGVLKISNPGYQVPIPAETIPCAMSGSTTVSGDLADIITPTITAGDFIRVEFNACDDGFGEVTDGITRMDFTAFSGDLLSQLFSMTATLTLTNFQASLFDGQSTTPVDVITTNGVATLTVNSTNSPFISTSVSGSSLMVDTNDSSESLTDFLSTSTIDGSLLPSPYTNSASGTLDSSALSGIISYSNPVEFAGLGVDYPSSGEFLVSGSDSSLLLIAEDNVNVRIEIDQGADGTVDETINTTWAELTAL